MTIGIPPNQSPIQDADGNITAQWQEFATDIFMAINALQTSGTTAQRPIKNLWIGRPYYDTTLGYSINVHQVTPAIVWHNGAGAAV